MDTQEIAGRLADVIERTPAKAQQIIEDPRGAVEELCGIAGVDVTPVLTATLDRLASAGVDLSSVDLSRLDLSQVDVSRLDIASLQASAAKLRVDLSRLDMAAIASKLLGGAGSGLGGLVGGLFGRR